MTGTMYRLLKERKKEGERISSAGGKQSAWSKIGMGLGGLLAMGLTGGAATPLVAAMMAGGGTLAGGLLGRRLARGTKGGRIKAGRFYADEAKDLISQIGSDIWSGAGKSALGAGLTSLGGSISLGKEGLKLGNIGSVGKEGAKFNLANLWDKGKTAATAPGTYSDSLWGKLGEAIDYKGSFVGKGLGQLQSWQTGRELQKMGEESIGTLSQRDILFGEGEFGATADFPQTRRHAQFAPGEMTAIMEGNISPQSKIDMPATAAAAEAPIFGGDFDADRYRILKEGEALRAAEAAKVEAGKAYYQDETAKTLLNLQAEAGYGIFDEDFKRSNWELDPRTGEYFSRTQTRNMAGDRLRALFGDDLDTFIKGEAPSFERIEDLIDNRPWKTRLFGD